MPNFHTDSLLPKNDRDLAIVMLLHSNREEMRLAPRMLRWALATLYLAGERRFEIRTPWGPFLRMEELELDGNAVPMHINYLLSVHNKVVGMLNGMDLGPLISRADTTLAAIRDKATAQVVLDAISSGSHNEHTKRLFTHYFTYLGSAGLHAEVNDFPMLGLTGESEVVHPREVYPWPSVAGDLSKIRGLMRDRWVPWEAIRSAFKYRGITPDTKDGLELTRRVAGQGEILEWVGPSWEINNQGLDGARVGPVQSFKDKSRPEELWCRLRELWVDGPRGTVSQYAASSGNYLFTREDYRSTVAFRPLAFGRFYDSGDFHGAGIADLVFSLARELEKMIRDMVANVREIDKFSTVVLPAGVVDEKKFFADNRSNVRALTVDPEPKGVYGTQTPIRPITITPPNSGDIPGKTANFLLATLNGLSPLRDIAEDKGRVDSFSGLQLLQDEAQRPIATPVSSLTRIFGEAYRYMASQAFNLLAESPRPIPVGRLSLDLVGAVIDPETSTLSFSGGVNAPPDLTRLNFGVKQTNLRMLSHRKAEAFQILSSPVPIKDPTDFLIFVLEEGQDYAMWLGPERAAYDMVLTNIISLYGDGETPGQIISAPYLEKPEFQLRILNAFMSSPKMRVASPDVIDAFSDYRGTLINWTGSVIPESVPDPYTLPPLQQMMTAPGRGGAGGLPSLPAGRRPMLAGAR